VADPSHKRPDAPIFYSELMRAMENLGLDKASGAQWLGTLNNLRGVKKEEMRWVGLPEWLSKQENPVTKEHILDFLRTNEVRTEELVYEGGLTAEESIEYENLCNQGMVWGFTQEEERRLKQLEAKMSEQRTRYVEYQLPGGENYRELLLMWPDAKESYESLHFDEPNVLVHVRFNERKDAQDKRVLFIEEIQSDWHQAGRMKGYRSELDPIDITGYRALFREQEFENPFPLDGGKHPDIDIVKGWEIFDAQGTLVEWQPEKAWITEREALERYKAAAEQRQASVAVPDAPFRTSWPELALKRMMRWAAEHGFDRIGWTTGAQQVERYGYEAGDRVYRFYDKVLPAVANKYGKRWGVTAGQMSMVTGSRDHRQYEDGFWRAYDYFQSVGNPYGTREDAREFLHEELKREGLGGMVEVHSFDMTPAMRDSVMQGQPLFLAFGNGTPDKTESRDVDALKTLSLGLETWRDQESIELRHREGEIEQPAMAEEKPVTHEQSNRESQEAEKIREGMMAKIAERVEKKMEELRASPMAEWYGKVQDVVSAPLADIRRRVVEEGFYGKTVFDVVHDRQNQNTFWGPQQEKQPVQQPVEDQDAAKSQYDREMADIMKEFYGEDQGRDDDDQDMGHGRGMER
jgi:hypothetical protein